MKVFQSLLLCFCYETCPSYLARTPEPVEKSKGIIDWSTVKIGGVISYTPHHREPAHQPCWNLTGNSLLHSNSLLMQYLCSLHSLPELCVLNEEKKQPLVSFPSRPPGLRAKQSNWPSGREWNPLSSVWLSGVSTLCLSVPICKGSCDPTGLW